MTQIKMFRMRKDLNAAMNADENLKNNPDMLEVRTKTGIDCKVAWAGNQRATYLKREGIQYICH
jgi:hypothetical protein